MNLIEATAEVENIRTTSKTIHEAITRLQEMWHKLGYTVYFVDYPTNFNINVSNTHASPKGYPTNWGSKPDKPYGYPGWSGRLEGSVRWANERSDNKQPPYFSYFLQGSSKDKLPSVPWLKTGTGGGGQDFRYDSKVFIYDMPVMHKEFMDAGDEFKVIKSNYINSVKGYIQNYNKELNEYVSKNTNMVQIEALKNNLSKMYKDCDNIKYETKQHFTKKFNSKYGVEIPMPTTIFENDSKIKNMIISSSDKINAKPLSSLESTIKHINTLQDDLNNLIGKKPELFL